MTPADFAPFALAIAASNIALGIVIGIGIERWRTSPQRRIAKKYRAERQSAMRD